MVRNTGEEYHDRGDMIRDLEKHGYTYHLDFEIMDDYDFGNKYGCTIWQRRQQNPIIVKVDNNPANPYNQFPNSTY